MLKNTRVLIVSAFIMTVAFVASYLNFTDYRPKTVRQVPDVKGIQTENISNNNGLPLPDGAQKVATSNTTDSTQVTFHTNKTKTEVQDYYKNILNSNKWTLDSEGIYSQFIVTKYKKDTVQISVVTYDTDDGYKTLVSIETTNL